MCHRNNWDVFLTGSYIGRMRTKKSKRLDACVHLLWGYYRFFCNQKFYSFNPKGLMWSTRDRLLDKFLKKKGKKDETKYKAFSSVVELPSKKGSSISSRAFVTLAKFSAFPSIFYTLNSFKSCIMSLNFSNCSSIPIKSIKYLQAFFFVLCLSMSNGTRPLCCANDDPW